MSPEPTQSPEPTRRRGPAPDTAPEPARESTRRPPPGSPPELAALLESVEPAAGAPHREVEARLDRLTKPPGSLGRLERLAVRLARIRGDPPPPVDRPAAFVLAGDHGVARRGVSAYPTEVTAQMCRNLARGGAAINALAGSVGCAVVVADLGVDADLEDVEGLLHRKVRRGTADLSAGAAMTRDEAVAAVLAGSALVAERRPRPDAVALGEMGIGNSTAASAATAALTGAPARDVVGPGTGVDGSRLERKRDAVRAAARRLRAGGRSGPLRILHEAGGLEIAGLVGVVLAGARARTPVVADGFIATAAAALAVRMAPAAGDYLFAGHRSTEPGHRILLEELGLEPVLDLELRLGEGTGAVLALPILNAAGAILREMATFESAGIAGAEPAPGGGGDVAPGAEES